MKLLRIRSCTQFVDGIQTPCYGIYFLNELIRIVSVFDYDRARDQVNRANDIIESKFVEMEAKEWQR